MASSFSPSRALCFSCLVLVSLVAAGCATQMPYGTRIEQSRQSGICYVHHEPMKKERLRVAYGLIVSAKEWSDARVSRFPFAHRAILGGCMIVTVTDHPELSSPAFEEDYVCARCTEAKDRWLQQHPKFKDER